MEELYRENILEHYKRPHNWSPPAARTGARRPPVPRSEPAVRRRADGQAGRRRRRTDHRRAVRGPRLRDLAGGRLDDVRRDRRDEALRPARARPLVRARPAGDRHLGDPDEVRAAVAEGAQVGIAGTGDGLGARDARTRTLPPPAGSTPSSRPPLLGSGRPPCRGPTPNASGSLAGWKGWGNTVRVGAVPLGYRRAEPCGRPMPIGNLPTPDGDVATALADVGTRAEVRSDAGSCRRAMSTPCVPGLSALEAGGNAIDAVVAGAFAAFVAEPNNAGIGGYGHLSAFLAGPAAAASSRSITVPAPPRPRSADMFEVLEQPLDGHDWPSVAGDRNYVGGARGRRSGRRPGPLGGACARRPAAVGAAAGARDRARRGGPRGHLGAADRDRQPLR